MNANYLSIFSKRIQIQRRFEGDNIIFIIIIVIIVINL
jgi:hypothetical protein